MSAEERLDRIEAALTAVQNELDGLRQDVIRESGHVNLEFRRVDRLLMVLTGAIAGD